MAPTPESNAGLVESDASDKILKYKEILKSNGIQDAVSDVIFKDSSLRGENFASVTEYITVEFQNPDRKPLNLFAKQYSSNPAHSAMLEEANLFRKETMFFCEYLPKAREHCKAMGKEDLMDIYPKCYYGDDKMLVFENLVVDKGFELLKKEERQGLEAAKIALASLAKHHSIAHALIAECGGPKEFFGMYPLLRIEAFSGNACRQFMEPVFENGIKNNIAVLQKSGLKGSIELVKKFEDLIGKTFDELLQLLEEATGHFLVLNHGDYWNNNMMFLKEEGTGRLIDHKTVDFQVIRYNSPSVDLSYFLFTSVKSDVRRGNLRSLLETYLDVLKNSASDLGHPISLTYEELKDSFCKKFRFGLWFGTLLMSEAGYSVLKEIDMTAIEDMGDFSVQIDKLIKKWLDDHPEKCAEMAIGIMNDMEEMERLTQGIIA